MEKKGLATFALAMLITSAVDSIRNLPATALFGSTLIFFFLFAAFIFLIPSALVAAELAANCPEESGIFHWVKSAFGEPIGFFSVWLQWTANLIWFPTVLSFVASLLAFSFEPSLMHNKIFLVATISATFWILTLVNFKGLHLSARLTSLCTIFGIILPVIAVILFASIWLLDGNASQLHFSTRTMLPSFTDPSTWVSLTAIMAGFVGIEVSAVHVKEVRHPQETFPKALGISIIFILIGMLLGALAIAIILPAKNMSLVNGVMQAFSVFLIHYKLKWLVPIIAILILLGSFGGMISWVISPAKGMLQAGQMGYLPLFLRKINKHGVATNLLILQAIIVSTICVIFLCMPSVSGSYWLLTALNAQIYMGMYLLMFFAFLKVRYEPTKKKKIFRIPGGKMGAWVIALLGVGGCILTIAVGFFPPSTIDVGGVVHYDKLLTLGMAIVLSPVIAILFYKNKKSFTLLEKPSETNGALETLAG